jgi:proteasome lid subunit RPN8/RPN11
VTVRLSAPSAAAIGAHARAAYPDECCGVLIGRADPERRTDRDVLAALRLENEAADARGRRYLISADQHLACDRLAARFGLDVVGFYHSHPNHSPVPSFVDRALGWPWYCFLIAAVDGTGAGPLRAWMLRDDRSDFTELDIDITGITGAPA